MVVVVVGVVDLHPLLGPRPPRPRLLRWRSLRCLRVVVVAIRRVTAVVVHRRLCGDLVAAAAVVVVVVTVE